MASKEELVTSLIKEDVEGQQNETIAVTEEIKTDGGMYPMY